MVEVVLPTPPFWLHIAMIFAGPWDESGAGSGIDRRGRPVGPSSTSATGGADSASRDPVAASAHAGVRVCVVSVAGG